MQIAIDSSKRRYAINVTDEIHRIKNDIEVKTVGYPAFWRGIHPSMNRELINKTLICPMNMLFGVGVSRYYAPEKAMPISDFLNLVPLDMDGKKARKIEDFIQEFGLRVKDIGAATDTNQQYSEYLLLRSDYDDMLQYLKRLTYSSKTLAPLMSWLLNRAFVVSSGMRRNTKKTVSTTNKNKSALIKVLYDLNPDCFLSLFQKLPT